ncbi:MAG: NAD(P)/FAD-dependent oxidoreductase [Proteobacteria bacterium]|nr:NAD(P)/FAD-dependent oxidoreductase [Pseudomonadota bacterium]MDA1059720.1 NAD(P)/FAD-dependent oxidoreductase [Pseudomonadota bacterium]
MGTLSKPARADEALAEATQWLAQFAQAVTKRDAGGATELFDPACHWRDLLAFTWTLITFEGREEIRAGFDGVLASVATTHWEIDGAPTLSEGVVTAWFRFETAGGRARGCVRLRDGKCTVLFTALTELKGYEEKSGVRREEGIELGGIKGKRSWAEKRQTESARLGNEDQAYCLIVGASQGGLALAARLRQLDVPTLVIDKLERPGDAWRNRYKSLCLHDPVWVDHMPYLPFPAHWPVYTPKDKMADWLEMYAKVMELDVWCSTECTSASYDADENQWSVNVVRAGRATTLQPTHLILATGLSGMPRTPTFPGAEAFQGVQVHSSAYHGGSAFAGKRCVVVGSNNSAHDICQDLWECGADVTMIQRSPTLVVRLKSLRRIADAGPFSEAGIAAGITTEEADFAAASTPFRLLENLSRTNYAKIEAWDRDFYDRLRAVGFQFHFGEDETGILMMYLRRAAGYYIDVGASDLIANGEIKLISGDDVAGLQAAGLVLQSGAEVPADLIVYATGYGPMAGWAEQLISTDVADKIGPCWGLGSDTRDDPGPWEGELRNMWKPTAQEGLWFQGGNLAQARHYSRYLALQLKARLEGLATPVYRRPGNHIRPNSG